MDDNIKKCWDQQQEIINKLKLHIEKLEELQSEMNGKIENFKVSVAESKYQSESEDDDSEEWDDEDLSEYDFENDSDGEFNPENANISLNLIKDLGMSGYKNMVDSLKNEDKWVPPTRSGLNNSKPLI